MLVKKNIVKDYYSRQTTSGLLNDLGEVTFKNFDEFKLYRGIHHASLPDIPVVTTRRPAENPLQNIIILKLILFTRYQFNRSELHVLPPWFWTCLEINCRPAYQNRKDLANIFE